MLSQQSEGRCKYEIDYLSINCVKAAGRPRGPWKPSPRDQRAHWSKPIPALLLLLCRIGSGRARDQIPANELEGACGGGGGWCRVSPGRTRSSCRGLRWAFGNPKEHGARKPLSRGWRSRPGGRAGSSRRVAEQACD